MILHHTYAGTPGVIFDHSPGRGSHGVAVGLSDSDFHIDGRCGPKFPDFAKMFMLALASDEGALGLDA